MDSINRTTQILIVDDISENIQVLGQILSEHGYKILIANNGVQALKVTEKKIPDLILLDVMMPDMDGFETCRRLKDSNKTSNIPIIFLTAKVETDDIVKGFQLGAVDYVSKPFQSLELLARVKTQLEIQRLRSNLEEMVGERTIQLSGALKVVEEKTKQLEISQHDLIDRLGRAAEYRDNETGMHLKRMSRYSVILAKAAGLDDEKIAIILDASVMHDIGKIGIPDNILLKPGKLTTEEFEIMKKHPVIGAELLSKSDSELVKLAEKIALSHHEKWNGKGYPNGLKEEEIPIEVRIVAIADVFDALTSERPYKKAWSVEDAVEFIKKEKGEHFDPVLVDLFIENLSKVIEIKEKFWL